MNRLLCISLTALACSFASAVFAETAPAHGTAKTWYQQSYYKLVHGSGAHCYDAQFAMHEAFTNWRTSLADEEAITRAPGFVSFVGLPSLDPRTCGVCAITEAGSQTACLARVWVESFADGSQAAPDAPMVISGKPHGSPLRESPWFDGEAYGLDCTEATHGAQVELYQEIEAASPKYEFGNLNWLNCACDRKSFPRVARCRARVESFYRDSRP